MKLPRILTVALAFNLVPAFAFCQNTTVSFSGTVGAATGVPDSDTSIANPPPELVSLEGETFSFELSYPNLGDLNVNSTNIGNFAGLSSASVTFGANQLDLVASPQAGQIEVKNDITPFGAPGSSVDSFGAFLFNDDTTLTAGAFPDFDDITFRLLLQDDDGTIFSDDSLITDAALLEDLDNFDSAFASLQFQNDLGTAGGVLLVDLQDTTGQPLSLVRRAAALNAFFPGSAVAVPEPSGGILVLAIAGVLGTLRRRQQIAV